MKSKGLDSIDSEQYVVKTETTTQDNPNNKQNHGIAKLLCLAFIIKFICQLNCYA